MLQVGEVSAERCAGYIPTDGIFTEMMMHVAEEEDEDEEPDGR